MQIKLVIWFKIYFKVQNRESFDRLDEKNNHAWIVQGNLQVSGMKNGEGRYNRGRSLEYFMMLSEIETANISK